MPISRRVGKDMTGDLEIVIRRIGIFESMRACEVWIRFRQLGRQSPAYHFKSGRQSIYDLSAEGLWTKPWPS